MLFASSINTFDTSAASRMQGSLNMALTDRGVLKKKKTWILEVKHEMNILIDQINVISQILPEFQFLNNHARQPQCNQIDEEQLQLSHTA